MCVFTDVLGSGQVLLAQLITIACIALSIVFWVFVYRKEKVAVEPYIVPIALWAVFGTLDILITARGTLGDPLREGNPLARAVFVEFGFWGPAIASMLWIALWSFIVLAINFFFKKDNKNVVEFVSLAIFYSLAAGHIFGFSSWFAPFCGFGRAYASTMAWVPKIVKVIAIGAILASSHKLFNLWRADRDWIGRVQP